MVRSQHTSVQQDRPANAFARLLTGRPYVSWSQINAMRRCPRAFAFQYVEDVTPAFTPAALIFGSSIHAGLEMHFHCLLQGLPACQDDLLTAYEQQWHEQIESGLPIRYGKTEDEQSLRETAERMFGSFLASPAARPDGDIVAIEESLRAPVSGEVPDLLARVDLVLRDDDGLHVIDHKTTRSRWSQQKAQEAAEQLILYERLARPLCEGREEIHLHFLTITKAKSPVVEMLDVDVADRTEHIIETVEEVWAAICEGHYYASPSAISCPSCPYQQHCPAMP